VKSKVAADRATGWGSFEPKRDVRLKLFGFPGGKDDTNFWGLDRSREGYRWSRISVGAIGTKHPKAKENS